MTAICKVGISLVGRKGKQPRATHATPCVAISRDICRYTAHVKSLKYFRCFLRMKCKPQTSQQQLQLNPDHKPPGVKFTSRKPQTFHTQQHLSDTERAKIKPIFSFDASCCRVKKGDLADASLGLCCWCKLTACLCQTKESGSPSLILRSAFRARHVLGWCYQKEKKGQEMAMTACPSHVCRRQHVCV